MRRVNNVMPESIKNDINSAICALSDRATITAVTVRADYSIMTHLGINGMQQCFYPRLTKHNFFTYGGTFAKVTKLVNLIRECEYVSSPVVKLVRKYKNGYVVPEYVKKMIGTDREYIYFDYSVIISFDGKTPEKIKQEAEYKAELERKQRELEEYARKRKESIEYWKELHKNETYEFAGCANGWGDNTPEIVKIADNDAESYYESYNIGHCLTKYVCHKYKFYYTVDSSD